MESDAPASFASPILSMHQQGSNFMQAPPATPVTSQDNTPRTKTGTLGSVMGSLGWPVIIGLVAYWGFLFLIQQGWIKSEMLVRYLSAHPVSYVATAMFFVGGVGLIIKLIDVLRQIGDQKNVCLQPAPALGQRADASRMLLADLDELSPARQDSYLGLRLRNALEFVDKTESANGLDDELKYLADMDAAKQQESYSLIRILIWAIPMLGFLGTVVGISGALGGLTVASDFEAMLSGLRDKLYVAFDTTALALTLSIVLMFAQFIVNRIETQHLDAVDEAAIDELVGRFETFGTNRDPYLSSVENMSRKVLQSVGAIADEQAGVWASGIETIRQTTEGVLDRFADVLATRLSNQLEPVMDEFGIAIRNAIADSNIVMESHTRNLSKAVEASSNAFASHGQFIGAAMSEQSKAYHSTIQQHGDELKVMMSQSNKLAAGHTEKLLAGLEQTEGVLQTQSEQMADASAHHLENLKTIISQSDEVLIAHAEKVTQRMDQATDIVLNQAKQLHEGIANANQVLESNTNSVHHSIEQGNLLIASHTERIKEVIAVSSDVMNDHASKISDAVTRSEEIVDKRQESIAKTQESMLRAQTQQAMAITQFTEKLEDLQEAVEQANSMNQMQESLKKSIDSLTESDSLIKEVKGLARVVRESVTESNEQQSDGQKQSQRNLEVIANQIQAVFGENAKMLTAYQKKQDELITATMQMHKSMDKSEDNRHIVEGLSRNFTALGKQIAMQQESLQDLAQQIPQNMKMDEHVEQLKNAIQAVAKNSSSAIKSDPIVAKLDKLQDSLTKPNPFQQQFLAQQKQTVDNQNRLLEFCQTLEGKNRTQFLDSAKSVLAQHSEALEEAAKLEETVRNLTFSVNLLNQSLSTETNKAVELSNQLNQPEIPKRVA
jgi:biopolymer transport protein ExbB/TolQ